MKVEYPKWIYPKDGEPFVVQTKEEHDAYLASVRPRRVSKKKTVRQ